MAAQRQFLSRNQQQALMGILVIVVGIAVSANLRAAAGNTALGRLLSGGFLARNG